MTARSNKRSLALMGCIGTIVLGAGYLQLHAARSQAGPAAPAPRAADAAPAVAVNAVLAKYCVTCHNSRLKTAGLVLDNFDRQRVGDDAEMWEKVASKFRTHEMPPPGRPRPDRATYAATTAYLEKELDA